MHQGIIKKEHKEDSYQDMDKSVTNYMVCYRTFNFKSFKFTPSKDRSLMQNIIKLPTPFDCLILDANHPCKS